MDVPSVSSSLTRLFEKPAAAPVNFVNVEGISEEENG